MQSPASGGFSCCVAGFALWLRTLSSPRARGRCENAPVAATSEGLLLQERPESSEATVGQTHVDRGCRPWHGHGPGFLRFASRGEAQPSSDRWRQRRRRTSFSASACPSGRVHHPEVWISSWYLPGISDVSVPCRDSDLEEFSGLDFRLTCKRSHLHVMEATLIHIAWQSPACGWHRRHRAQGSHFSLSGCSEICAYLCSLPSKT